MAGFFAGAQLNSPNLSEFLETFQSKMPLKTSVDLVEIDTNLLYYKALGILTYVMRVLGNGQAEHKKGYIAGFSSMRRWSWAYWYGH